MDRVQIYDSDTNREAFPLVNYNALESPYFEVFVENALKGVRDTHSGTVVVKPVFEDIGIMYDECGSLLHNIINIKECGEWHLYRLGRGYLVSPRFKHCGHIREGLRHVSYRGLHGFVDENYKIVLPFVFADAKSFSEGMCAVKWIPKDEWDRNDGWGYIDHTGECIVCGQYSDACKFHSGYARVQQTDDNFRLLTSKLHLSSHLSEPRNWGIIDKHGNTIMPCDNQLDVVKAQLSILRNPVQSVCVDQDYRPNKDDIAITRDLVFVRNSKGMVVSLNRKGESLSECCSDDSCKGIVAGSWRSIRHVAGGFDHAMGLTVDGRIVSTGNTQEFTKGIEVLSWRNIAMLDACEGHVAGVTLAGHVEIATEKDGYEVPTDYAKELHEIVNAQRIAVGWLHAAVLLADGSVRIVGECAESCAHWKDIVDVDVFGCYYSPAQTVGLTSTGRVLHTLEDDIPDNWRDIVSVSCGNQFIVSLDKDGRVKACGRNDQGQCDIEDWPQMLCAKGDFFRTVAIDRDGWVWMTPVGRTQINVFSKS